MTTQSATGSTSSSKIRTTLTIQVETIDFDTQASMLRIKGRNIEENQYVKVNCMALFYLHLMCYFNDKGMNILQHANSVSINVVQSRYQNKVCIDNNLLWPDYANISLYL